MLFNAAILPFALHLAALATASPIQASAPPTQLVAREETAPPSNETDLIGKPIMINLSVTDTLQVISTGFAGINSGFNIANYIGTVIKELSNANSCTTATGSLEGLNYQYHAATTGKRCDTTAQAKTIQAGVKKGLDWMNDNNVNQACLFLHHGGTWLGLLQIAAGGRSIISNKCDGAVPNIVIK